MDEHPDGGAGTRTPSRPSGAPEPQTDTPRRRARSHGRGVPSGRAVVGGLLIAVAAVGAFAVQARADGAPHQRAVVVRSDVPAGHRLTSGDLGEVAVDLPAGSDASVFHSSAELVGAVTLAPLRADELVQHSAVLTGGAEHPTGHEFSFPVDRERAVGGDLQRGEAVDLLATFGTGADAYTTVLARRASVVDVASAGRGTLAGGGELVLTVALPSADQVLDAAHAAQVAELTVVRSTAADPADAGRSRTGGGSSASGRALPGTPGTGTAS